MKNSIISGFFIVQFSALDPDIAQVPTNPDPGGDLKTDPPGSGSDALGISSRYGIKSVRSLIGIFLRYVTGTYGTGTVLRNFNAPSKTLEIYR